MKKRISLLLSGFAVLALVIFFAKLFVTYAQPMRNDQLDLSLTIDVDEITSVDRCAELGWSIYTLEDDVFTPLAFDGLGCYDGLQHLGQTFYYTRIMTEKLNAASLSLTAINRNYSVFLDGVLIYTDCPEQDNRIGYLTLPSRDWERTENIVIPLPEDYVGKTLTIAQSTPLYTDSPRMATRVIPSPITLYCAYAYESELIAESFQTAYVAAGAYAVGLLLLFFFCRKLVQGSFDVSLLLLALTVFLTMAAQMYDTSYSMQYFAIPTALSTDTLCRWLATATLLCFLATKVQHTRIASWVLAASYALLTVLHIALLMFNNTSTNPAQILLFHIRDNAGFIIPMLFVIFAWVEFAKGSRFHRWFAPLCTLGIAAYVVIQLAMPSRDAFLSTLHNAVANFSLQVYAWPLTCLLLMLSVLLTAAEIICSELTAHTEKRLMKEMTLMSQQRYENLRRHNEEVMMLRHDMQRHFRLLRQTTTDENTAAYLDELLDKNEKIRPVIQSGNDMLDTILGSRLSAAMDAGIRVEIVRADAPAKLPVSDADMCSLIMNLIDNAINAAAAAEVPSITLDLHQKSGFFVFVCENTLSAVPAAAEQEKTVPKHGLGLKIVRLITERYGHLLTTEAGVNTYKVSLAIPEHQPSR